jgi:hypothetical protein
MLSDTFFIVMLNVIMLSFIILNAIIMSVVMLNVLMLSVVAPPTKLFHFETAGVIK